MSELGDKTVAAIGEWDELPPITLSRWQVRMVLQSLAASFDMYHEKRPSDLLPAVRAMVREEVVALIQATINDVAMQAGIIESVDMPIAVPTMTMAAASPKTGGSGYVKAFPTATNETSAT